MENEQKLAGEKLEQVNGGYPAGADFEKGFVCLETLTCFFCGQKFDSTAAMLEHAAVCPENPANKK